jgi:UDP-2,3-diacylglucosamine pyrophosphatase LpxH
MSDVAEAARALTHPLEARILAGVRVAAISDLHIGAEDGTDGFRHEPARFEAWLDDLEASHDRIVLLGDIFQTDHGWWPTRASTRRQLLAAQRRVGRLWGRLSGSKYVYVHGNHDAVARVVVGAPEHFVVAGRARTLFTHGHQFDPVARRAPALADLGTWTCGRLRAVGLRPAAQWLERRDVAIKHARFQGPHGPYADGARGLARRHAATIVVMGHTHVEGVERIPEGLAVNTGTCSAGAMAYASIDTVAGRVEVFGPGGRREARVDPVALQ